MPSGYTRFGVFYYYVSYLLNFLELCRTRQIERGKLAESTRLSSDEMTTETRKAWSPHLWSFLRAKARCSPQRRISKGKSKEVKGSQRNPTKTKSGPPKKTQKQPSGVSKGAQPPIDAKLQRTDGAAPKEFKPTPPTRPKLDVAKVCFVCDWIYRSSSFFLPSPASDGGYVDKKQLRIMRHTGRRAASKPKKVAPANRVVVQKALATDVFYYFCVTCFVLFVGGLAQRLHD